MHNAIYSRKYRTHVSLLAACALGGTSLTAAAAQSVSQQTLALPSGGEVRAGAAAISASDGHLTVAQSSPTAILSWKGFSVGSAASVRFDNGAGATLNRVAGNIRSQIDGSLSASGSVYLLNANGVVIGKSGVVDVGGSFVASTLDVEDAAFLSGGPLAFVGQSRAGAINLGKVSSLGGDVALIAVEARNEGQMSAANGTVALAAGSSVLMRDQALDGGRFAVLVGAPGSAAGNTGTLTAAIVELRASGGSVYALAGNMTGVIRAQTVATAGGRIFLTAGSGGTVETANTRLDASGTSGGAITVSGGQVKIDRETRLDASGTNAGGRLVALADGTLQFAGRADASSENGSGGFVETSGASVDFVSARVDTSGQTAGLWLVDPVNLTVDAPAAATINQNLRTTNVTLQTSASGSSGPGTSAPGDGDIVVAAPLGWSSPNRLTLDAYHAVRFDADVEIGGAGKLALRTASNDSGALLSFGSGSAIRFTGPADGGRALTINGQAYQLVDRFEQLAAIEGAGLGGLYAIARPLSASRVYDAAVIGSGDAPFTGTLEGLGNSISGLTIRAPGVVGVGLFRVLTGTARDLVLSGGSIVGGGGYTISDAGKFLAAGTGALAGLVGEGGIVTNVTSNYSVTAQAPDGGVQYTGGLIGYLARGRVTNAHATGAVKGDNDVGGLIGWIDGHALMAMPGVGVVENSSATGRVSGSSSIGGLVGWMQSAELSQVRAEGDVVGRSTLGGLVGGTATVTITEAHASGSVTGTSTRNSFAGGVGGLVGSFGQGSIVGGTASGPVTGYTEVGGLVGRMNGSISYSWASGTVRGQTAVGGLVGAAESFVGTLVVTHSQARGDVTGSTFVGGLVGNGGLHPVQITDSSASGSVAGRIGGYSVGGLIGELQYGDITDNSATGRVTGEMYVGGLIGRSVLSTVARNVARGPVEAIGDATEVGGLIGRSSLDDISGSLALNSVRGRTNVGGLIGYRYYGSLQNVFASGPVRGQQNTGALIGFDEAIGGSPP